MVLLVLKRLGMLFSRGTKMGTAFELTDILNVMFLLEVQNDSELSLMQRLQGLNGSFVS